MFLGHYKDHFVQIFVVSMYFQPKQVSTYSDLSVLSFAKLVEIALARAKKQLMYQLSRHNAVQPRQRSSRRVSNFA